jgi:S-adenosylmethionine hydrolase
MARSNNSFIKKQKTELKLRRKREKLEERQERKDQPTSGKLEDMIAYVDEFGNISDTPPEDAALKERIQRDKTTKAGK